MKLRLVGRLAAEGAWGICIVGAAAWLARAAPAETSGTLAFVGTLRDLGGKPLGGSPSMKVSFRSASKSCAADSVGVTPDAKDGAFRAELALGRCAGELFNGEDVSVDVSVDDVEVIHGQQLNPVPYAKHADQSGVPDCPLGYAREGVACRRGNDEVVKVGSGASAFYIDRYEASLWTEPYGAGTQVSPGVDEYPATFPKNGQHENGASLYAASVRGLEPNRFLTWFQATAACRASGKRLARADEWLAAARGTPDPNAPSSGAGDTCHTDSSHVRMTGVRSGCASAWGAEDMIGNLWEWTTEWYTGNDIPQSGDLTAAWPAGYRDDVVGNTVSAGRSGSAILDRAPVAALRGGDHHAGVLAGIFALSLEHAPSSDAGTLGMRCVVVR